MANNNGGYGARTYPDDFIDKIICGDCLDTMAQMEAKSIPLIIADPPYNIGKASWDKIPDYLNWCGDWIKSVERIMADNGSFYMFHSEMPVIAKLMEWIEQETSLIFKQMIVWNKLFYGTVNWGYLDGKCCNENLRNYKKMAEYILFYTFQDETGLSRVYDNRDCFRGIKEYLRVERKKAELTYPQVNALLGTAEGSGQPGHYFSDSQWCLPTAEMYTKLQTTGSFQREYEDLRREYEDLRYTFNNQKTHHSIWNYETVKNSCHPTQKPEALIANITLHSSNEGDMVLDPFAGVGTTALASIKTNRQYLCIEKEPKYVDIARERIRQEQAQLKLEFP